MDPLRESFSEVEYASFPRAATTPDRLAAVARLFAVGTPDPAKARVLEVGCSDGGNLIAMAMTGPNAKFVGFDFSNDAIARGQHRIRASRIDNVELWVADLREFPKGAGTFDYIIAHGVYSWVAPPLQEALLGLLQRHLAADGVAFVDYNAQPGSQVRLFFREALLFHVRRFSTARQRIDQARSFMKLIAEASPQGSVQRTMAEAGLKSLLRAPDSAIYHDLIGLENHPCYFHEFIAAADSFGLAYLGEADVSEMSEGTLGPEVRGRLAGLRDLIEREQYLDILKGRGFRQTLLCHKGRRISRSLDGSTLEELYFSSSAHALPAESGGEFSYRCAGGTLRTQNAMLKLLVDRLIQVFPARLRLSELILSMDSGAAATDLRGVLLFAILSGVVTIHAQAAAFTTAINEKPIASPLGRHQAAAGETIFNLNHEALHQPDEGLRKLLPLLDGTRDASALAEELGWQPDEVRGTLQIAAIQALLLG